MTSKALSNPRVFWSLYCAAACSEVNSIAKKAALGLYPGALRPALHEVNSIVRQPQRFNPKIVLLSAVSSTALPRSQTWICTLKI